jgi:hypothetical protein
MPLAVTCPATSSSLSTTSQVRDPPRGRLESLKQARALGNIGNPIRVLSLEDPTTCAPNRQRAHRSSWSCHFGPASQHWHAAMSTGSDKHRWMERNMRASDSLFCFASNKIEIHPCPNCRAPMLVRINSAGLDTSVRTFECFNCDAVVIVPNDQSELSL